MVVAAVTRLDPGTLDLKMIGVKKVIGGGLRDSFLVDGVAFKKTFSYAGFEQQPKAFKGAGSGVGGAGGGGCAGAGCGRGFGGCDGGGVRACPMERGVLPRPPPPPPKLRVSPRHPTPSPPPKRPKDPGPQHRVGAEE
jgi:hypothetical protein